MQSMHDYDEIGLRERKKAATRLAIERAAVDLACDHGYEAATAEAIAARAGVSLRTFFNYFPGKDVAIVGTGLLHIDDEQAERILEETAAGLLKGIVRVAAACAAETDPSSALMRRRRKLIHRYPPLFHPHVTGQIQFDNWLTGVVSAFLQAHPERRHLSEGITIEEEARLAVIMVSVAVRYLAQQAIDNDIDAPLTAEDIDRTIDMMARIHREDT
jgi:AcrR family transcriptional regulator